MKKISSIGKATTTISIPTESAKQQLGRAESGFGLLHDGYTLFVTTMSAGEPLRRREADAAVVVFGEHQVARDAFMARQRGTDQRAGDVDQIIDLCTEEARAADDALEPLARAVFARENDVARAEAGR